MVHRRIRQALRLLDKQDTYSPAHDKQPIVMRMHQTTISAKVDMVCLSHVGYGVYLTFRALTLRRRRLTLETSAKHHIPQVTKIPYQPLLIKPMFSVLAHAEKQFFQN